MTMKNLMIRTAALIIGALLSYSVYADQIIGFRPKEQEASEVQEAIPQKEQEQQEAPAEDQPPAEEETTTDDGFVAPDTYPAYLAPQYASETYDGIAFLYSDDGTYIIIVGFRGDRADGGNVAIPPEIDSLPVTEIAESAFAGNDVIRTLIIPDSVKTVGEYAVSRCFNLESVTLPESMTVIPDGMFEGCGALKNITFSPLLSSIGNAAFSGCSSLSKIKVPASLERIGVDSFAACERLVLDCSENSYAAGYAEVNGIETAGSETWESMVIKMAVITALLGAAVIAAPRIFRKIVKSGKTPEGSGK